MSILEPAAIEGVEDIRDFESAATFLIAHQHGPKKLVQTQTTRGVQGGSGLVDLLIKGLWFAERPSGASYIMIFMSPLYYYHILKECRSVVEVVEHSSMNGYAGTILGHPFLAHARIKDRTMVVASRCGDLCKTFVASSDGWEEGDPLFL